MKGNLNTFFFLITSQIILLLLVSTYSAYMITLNCPSYDKLQDDLANIPVNETNAWTALTTTWTVLTILFSGCAGIPWWVFIITFLPALIAIIVYIVPYIGDG